LPFIFISRGFKEILSKKAKEDTIFDPFFFGANVDSGRERPLPQPLSLRKKRGAREPHPIPLLSEGEGAEVRGGRGSDAPSI
jgi:hypothetical protein